MTIRRSVPTAVSLIVIYAAAAGAAYLLMRISGGYHASVLCCSLGAFLVLYVRGFQRAFVYFGALVISGYAAEIADMRVVQAKEAILFTATFAACCALACWTTCQGATT